MSIKSQWRIRVFAAIFSLLSPGYPAFAADSTTEISLDAAIEKAIRSNPEIREADSRLGATRISERLSVSPFLPKIALEAGHDTRKSNEESRSGEFLYGTGRLNLYNGGMDSQLRRIARSEKEKAEADLKFAQQRVVREVVRSFLDLVFLEEALKFKSDAINLNASQMKIARRKASGGLTSNADVLEFEFRENSLRTEIALLEHQRNLASRNLSVNIGESPSDGFRPSNRGRGIEGVVSSLKNGTTANLAPAQEEALIIAEKDLDIAQSQYKSALATWLPKADLIGQYGNLQFAEPDVRGIPGWSLQFKITIPIFSGLETAVGRKAEVAVLSQREARVAQTRLALSNQLAHQKEKLVVIDRLLVLQKENVSRAEKYYQATMEEYRRGVKNAPDLSNATERLFVTRLRTVELLRDRTLTELGLIEATGLPIP